MKAVLKRELKAYFTSPLGFVFLAVFCLLGGFYFYASVLATGSGDMAGLFVNMTVVAVILIPILTMRLFSEDLRLHTDQLLFTAPVKLSALVLGKFLSALIVYGMALCTLVFYASLVSLHVDPGWWLVLGNLLALLLMGMALIAIGLFISSLTASQMVAAAGTMVVSLLLLAVDSLGTALNAPGLSAALHGLSFTRRISVFASGIFDLSGAVFFVSICGLFLFLTVQVLEKRRWA